VHQVAIDQRLSDRRILGQPALELEARTEAHAAERCDGEQRGGQGEQLVGHGAPGVDAEHGRCHQQVNQRQAGRGERRRVHWLKR
jgi:hypothetical protein